MNCRTTAVLVVALLGLCGSAPCCSAASSEEASLIPSGIASQVVGHVQNALQPNENETNPLSGWMNQLEEIGRIPAELISDFREWVKSMMYTVIDAIRQAFKAIDSVITHWIRIVRSMLGIPMSSRKRRLSPGVTDFLSHWLGRAEELSGFLREYMDKMDEILKGQTALRKRRSVISDGLSGLSNALMTLPSIVLHPLSSMSSMMSAVGNTVTDQAENVFWAVMEMTWTFLTKVALPFLHSILNDVDKTIPLPGYVHIFIENFNVIYNLAKLLGYIG